MLSRYKRCGLGCLCWKHNFTWHSARSCLFLKVRSTLFSTVHLTGLLIFQHLCSGVESKGGGWQGGRDNGAEGRFRQGSGNCTSSTVNGASSGISSNRVLSQQCGAEPSSPSHLFSVNDTTNRPQLMVFILDKYWLPWVTAGGTDKSVNVPNAVSCFDTFREVVPVHKTGVDPVMSTTSARRQLKLFTSQPPPPSPSNTHKIQANTRK